MELVHITRPEDSWPTFDALVGHAEAVRVATLLEDAIGRLDLTPEDSRYASED